MTKLTPFEVSLSILANAFANTLSLEKRDNFAAEIKRTSQAYLLHETDNESDRTALVEGVEWARRLARELILSPSIA